MSFADTLQWGWICLPFSLKALFSALYIMSFFCVFLSFTRRDIAVFLVGIITNVFVLWAISAFPPYPTTKNLVFMYEKGDIDKVELTKYLPYAIAFEKKEARNKKEEEAKKKREEEALKILKEEEANRKKEAEELLKKFKEEE